MNIIIAGENIFGQSYLLILFSYHLKQELSPSMPKKALISLKNRKYCPLLGTLPPDSLCFRLLGDNLLNPAIGLGD